MGTITHAVKIAGDAKSATEAIREYADVIVATAATVGKYERQLGNEALLRNAHNMVAAVQNLGGVSALTDRQQQQLNKTLSEAIQQYERLGKAAPSAMVAYRDQAAAAVKQTDSWTSSLKGLAGQLGLALSAGSVVAFAKSLLETADELQKVSDRTGMTAEAVQQLQYIGGQTGVALDAFTRSIGQMQNRLASGDASAVAALEALGLRLDEIRAMAPDEQFLAIGDAVGSIEDPMRRTQLAMDLFGRGGQEILPAVRANMRELADDAPKMSSATVKALDDIGDSFSRLGAQAKAAIANFYVGAVQGVEDAIGAWYKVRATFAWSAEEREWWKNRAWAMQEHTSAVTTSVPVVQAAAEETRELADATNEKAAADTRAAESAAEQRRMVAALTAEQAKEAAALREAEREKQRAMRETERVRQEILARTTADDRELYERSLQAVADRAAREWDMYDKMIADSGNYSRQAIQDQLEIARAAQQASDSAARGWDDAGGQMTTAIAGVGHAARAMGADVAHGMEQAIAQIHEMAGELAAAAAEAEANKKVQLLNGEWVTKKEAAALTSMGGSETYDLTNPDDLRRLQKGNPGIMRFLEAGYSLQQAMALLMAERYNYSADVGAPSGSDYVTAFERGLEAFMQMVQAGGWGPGGAPVPGYAAGTLSAAGGWAMVGERGPELVRLPRGASVYPDAGAVTVAIAPGAIVIQDGMFDTAASLDRLAGRVGDAIVAGLKARGYRMSPAG